MSTFKTIISTTAFWLLCFSFGSLYALFALGWEIHLPAGNPPQAVYSQADQNGLEQVFAQASHKRNQ